MNLHFRLFQLSTLFLFAFTLNGERNAAPSGSLTRPNVIFIMVDDLGWADLGCYGNTIIETPNLDRLASQGIRFTQAYASSAVCSPNRAAILTGKYPARLHITDWIPGMVWPQAKLKTPGIQYELPLEETTLAEIFKKEQYDTYFVGKWHLGDSTHWPQHQGFDVNIGGHSKGHPASHFYPFGHAEGKKHTHAVLNLPPGAKEGDYLDDFLTGQALELIRKSHREDRPFFLNFWPYGVHMPLQGKDYLVEKYKQKVAAAGSKFNPTYCAMVEDIDENIGRLMALLDETGLTESTLIIFTSDNGGLEEINGNAHLRRGKGTLYEGGIRVPMMVKHPGKIPAGIVSSEPVAAIDWLPTLTDYLNLGNTPVVDGHSFSNILQGAKLSGKQLPMIWHNPHYHTNTRPPVSAIRLGNFKLIHFYEENKDELYDLVQDPKESVNLAAEKKGKTRILHRKLMRMLKQMDASFPQPNPNHDPQHPFENAFTGWKGENSIGK